VHFLNNPAPACLRQVGKRESNHHVFKFNFIVLFVLTQKEPKKSSLFKNWLKLTSFRCQKITRFPDITSGETQTDFLAALIQLIT
jgi:hypothetical protein